MLSQLDRLRNGEITPDEAKASAVLAAVALKTVDTQLRYAQMVHDGHMKPETMPEICFNPERGK